MILEVAVPLPISRTFSYAAGESTVAPGSRVVVPFSSYYLVGMVVDFDPHPAEDEAGELKSVCRILDERPILSPTLLQLGRWIASYYLAPPGEVYRSMLPPGLMGKKAGIGGSGSSFWPARLRKAVTEVRMPGPGTALSEGGKDLLNLLAGRPLPVVVSELIREAGCSHSTLRRLEEKGLVRIEAVDIPRSPFSGREADLAQRHTLSSEQGQVLEEIKDAQRKGAFASFLVHGVTGSGKTEVYLNAIASSLRSGRAALVLVPEIGLTPQISHQFRSWFGHRVAILHSGLSQGERFDEWRRIKNGAAPVVIGTRSAVFAPVENLGIVIVDEEHDGSYKQEETPRYSGREVAIKRAAIENAVVVLGSATPQIETYYRARVRSTSKYMSIESRVQARPLPAIHIVDMRDEFQKQGRANPVSELLLGMLREKLARGEQALILLNRRGYAAALICRSCGNVEACSNCSISLTFHREANRLFCHYCGYSKPVPARCHECKREFIHFLGLGTEQMEEILEGLFPGVAIARLDRDSTQRKGSYERILTAFRKGRTRILVGTQMIAKGHDFHQVTLVGVVDADQGLKFSDFRAAERTFQLLTQVAGRAGRGDLPGDVVIQTYYPNHYALKAACLQDYASFYVQELRFRKNFRYPPFTILANLIVRSEDREKGVALSRTVAEKLLSSRDAFSGSGRMRILGPAPAAIEKLKRDFRFQILLKATSRNELIKVLSETLNGLRDDKVNLRRIVVDIDPVNLM